MVGILKNAAAARPPEGGDTNDIANSNANSNANSTSCDQSRFVKATGSLEDRTESTVETACQKMSNDTVEEVPTKPQRPKMHARFGSVRVAWHRMTLGSAHPGGTAGVPVTLGELEEAERYETVDRFSQTFHYDKNNSIVIRKPKKKLERLTESTRRNIVLQNCTEEEVAEVEKEVTKVVGERKESSHEAKIQAFLEYKKKEREALKKKKIEEKAKRGGLFSCFGR